MGLGLEDVYDATRQDGKNVFKIEKVWGHKIVGQKLYWYVEYATQTSKGHASELIKSRATCSKIT